MVEYQIPSNFTTPLVANTLHLKDSTYFCASGDESIFPASTFSACSECNSSSDITSVLLTAPSTNSTNLLEESRADILINGTSAKRTVDPDEDIFAKNPLISGNQRRRVSSPRLTNFFSEPSNTMFMPIPAESVHSPRSIPSPGVSKMLRSLSDHPSERPCTPNASTLYKNTLTHCNPSELGQQTYDECMFFTQWTNSFLQHSQDKFLITDLVRDLGDGLTLLNLVEVLVGECPPQIHIKPALDVQKMENIQTCLNFLEYYNVSVNGIAAEDIVKGNLKVILALCHCLYRHFTSNPDKDGLALFGWVSKMIGKQVSDFQSFQDGTALCLLLNKFLEDAVPNLVLEFGSAFEKVSLALQVSSERLGIVSNVRTEDITQLREREQFLEYLTSLYLLHSRKTKSMPCAIEQTTLKRGISRLQRREQRLKKLHGSELTYPGEMGQKKSGFELERRKLPLGNPTVDILNSGRLNRTRQLRELEVVSPTESTTHSESFVDTKRELDELQEELRLLKLECCDDIYDVERYCTDRPRQFSFNAISSPDLPTSNLHQKQMNTRQELRNMLRGIPVSRQLNKRGQETVGSVRNNMGAFSRNNKLDSDGYNGKLPFGGCYLSEPSRGLENTERREFDESSLFTDYPVQLSFLGAFSPQRLSVPLVNSKKDKQNGLVLFPETSVQTKEISNLFDVDFTDLDARMSRGQDDSALKRMMRAGQRSKLNGTSRFALEAGLSLRSPATNSTGKWQDEGKILGTFDGNLRRGLGRKLGDTSKGDGEIRKSFVSSIDRQDTTERMGLDGDLSEREFSSTELSSFLCQTNENDQVTDGLSSSFARHDKQELNAVPLRSSRLGTPTYKDEEDCLSKETSPGTISRQSNEPPKQLQRSLSKEKRYREQVLAMKSASKHHPSSTKSHLHALTASIRSSARNAGASCSDED